MSGLLRAFDPDSTDEETRRLSRLAQGCWSPFAIVYDPLKAGSIDSTDTVPHDKAIVRAQSADFAPNKRIKGKPECTVFVANLNPSTSERSLRDEFNQYGRIVKTTVVEDVVTGRSRGYGFVEFSLEGEANKAYERAHRSWLDGNKIIVDMECGRLLPGWVPRRLGGGFNGRKESGQLRFGCRERPFRKPIKLLTEKEIKRVFEQTMGRKLITLAKGNAEPAADVLAGDNNNTTETAESKQLETSDHPDPDVPGKSQGQSSKRDEEVAKDERAGGRERTKHGRECDKPSGGRESEMCNDSGKHHKKKKKRRRSRSRSHLEDEERKRKHHKRRREHSRD